MPGRVLILNGPSSAGKTSLGLAMQSLLEEPWFLVPVDAINAMRAPAPRREIGETEMADVLRRTRAGYHRAVAGLAAAGNDVIMDYPLSEPWRLDDLLTVLADIDVTLVDVRCSPEELDRRERSRGDRVMGTARAQRAWDHDDRDLTVDTTEASAVECAHQVVRGLASVSRPTAFDRLRARRA